MRAFAFEGQHRIDHMFDDTRAGDLPVFGDVPDEDDGRSRLFGEADERLRRTAHLGYRTGGRFNRIGPHGLDGIDDDQARGLALREGCDDVFNRGFSGKLDGGVAQT
jgi:hypothetical protein